MMLTTKQYGLNRESAAYRRATAAGFTFGELRIMSDDVSFLAMGLRYTLDFTCVCGRRETFMQALTPMELSESAVHHPYVNGKVIDAVLALEHHGSFSREHLREDGYTPEQIDRIREPWDGPAAQHERRKREYEHWVSAMQSGALYGS
jgi:hypothetical protein